MLTNVKQRLLPVSLAVALLASMFSLAAATPATAATTSVSILKEITVGRNPVDVVTDGNYVWVANSQGDSVTLLDATTGNVIKTVGLGTSANPQSLCISNGNVFVAKYGWNAGAVAQLSGSTNTNYAGTQLSNTETSVYPAQITCDSNYVWVVNIDSVDSRPGRANSIEQINATTGALVRYIPVTNPQHAYSDGTYVWVNSGQRDLVKINALTGAIISTTRIGLDDVAGLDYFNHLTSDGTHVWVNNCWNNQITEYNISDMSIVRTVALDACSQLMRTDGTYLWTATQYSGGNGGGDYGGTIYQISLATGAIVNTIPLTSRFPFSVDSEGDYAWAVDGTNFKVLMIGVPHPPLNTVAPAMTDSTSASRFAVNDNVTTTDGTWRYSTGTYTYSWYRCTSNTASDVTTDAACSVISGATSATYKLTSSDSGKYIASLVTATGTDTTTGGAQSNFSSKMVLGPAVNTVAPVVTDTTLSGRFAQGDTVSTTTGTWTNATGTYTYKWYRCTTSSVSNAASDASCTAISGATSSTYVLTSSDVNKWIASVVTATGTDASTTPKASSLTIKITNPAVNTVAPVLSDTTSANRYKVGDTVSTTTGTWSSATGTYTYKWYRCTTSGVTTPDTDANCTVIGSATSSTYTLTTSDMGKYMIALVTATGNDSTTTSKASNMSSKAVVNPAVNSAAPVLSDISAAYSYRVGDTLSTTNGTWTNSNGNYTYSWYLCSGTVSDATTDPYCTVIAGATSSSLTLTSAHLGKYPYAVVTTTGLDGTTASKTSNMGGLVSDPAVITDLPVLSDTTTADAYKVGDVLNVTSGTWGNRTSGYTYTWYTCTSAYISDPASDYRCTVISGVTSTSYTVTTNDYSDFFIVTVSASGPDGNAVTAVSNVSIVAVPGPAVNTVAPSLMSMGGSTYTSGAMAVVSTGTWDRQKSYSMAAIAWYRCTTNTVTNPKTDSSCTLISGATMSQYTMTSSDVDKYLVAVVTATGTDDSTTSAVSNFSSKVVAGSSSGGGGGASTTCSIPGSPTVCDLTVQWQTWSKLRVSWSAPSAYPPQMLLGYTVRNAGSQATLCTVTSASTQFCDITWTNPIGGLALSVTPTLSYGSSSGDGPPAVISIPRMSMSLQVYRGTHGIFAVAPYGMGGMIFVGSSLTSTVTVGGKTCSLTQGVVQGSPISGDCTYDPSTASSFGNSFAESMGLAANTSYDVTGTITYSLNVMVMAGYGGQIPTVIQFTRPFSFTMTTLPAPRPIVTGVSGVKNSDGTYTLTWNDLSGVAMYQGFGMSAGVAVVGCSAPAVKSGSTWSCTLDGQGQAMDSFVVESFWDDLNVTSNTDPVIDQNTYGLEQMYQADGYSWFFSMSWVSTDGTSSSSSNGGGATAPGAPTGVSASAGNGQATVTWTAPASNGGSAITGYNVQYSTDGGSTWTTASCSGTSTSCTITGLTNGASYIFKVAATNSAGTGDYSSNSSSATPTAPATVPGAPTGVSASAGNGQATVTWTAPSSNGGAAITGYTVQYSTDGGSTWTTASCSGTSTSCTITGLTNGASYKFKVAATNSVGTGAYSSPSSPITPATAPDAPTNIAATPGNGSAVISWTAPASNGGSPVTSYTVTASPGGATCTVTAPATTCTVTGLTNGTSYTFTVNATNAAGTSSASSSSSAVVPTTTVPDAPTNVIAVGGEGQASISWTAPANDGGVAVDGYIVTASPGGLTCTAVAPDTTCVITGLDSTTSYTFTVVASNNIGPSVPSAPSNAITPAAGPSSPDHVQVTPGNHSATVTWTKPVDGATPTRYVVTMQPGDITCEVNLTLHPSAPLSCTFTGLTNGVNYTFTVTAYSGNGQSASDTVTAIPGARPTKPSAPRLVTFRGSVAGLGKLTWYFSGSNGGSPITKYIATVTGPRYAKSCVINTALRPLAPLTCNFPGLKPKRFYNYRVIAVNAIGQTASGKARRAIDVAVKIVSFGVGKTTMWSGLYRQAFITAGYIKKFKYTKVVLTGYTNPGGTAAGRTRFTQARALTVANYINRQLRAMGLKNVTVVAVGTGASIYKGPGLTPLQRKKNRSVTTLLTYK